MPIPAAAVVWARGGVRLAECPTSYVTPQSLAWLEMYEAWKLSGGPRLDEMAAREAEAIWVIHSEWRKESNGSR